MTAHRIDAHFGVPRLIAVSDAVVVLVQGLVVGAHQHRTEGSVSGFQCGAGKLDAAS